MNFDDFINGIRSEARGRMKRKIDCLEKAATISEFDFNARPAFSSSDVNELLQRAEDEAVGRLILGLRKFAFPEDSE